MKHLLMTAACAAMMIACEPSEKKPDPIVASIDSVMQSVVDTAEFNGNVLVAQKGKIVYQKSFGVANYYMKEPLNDSTLFELASVSKAFTAMSIMMLKEDGKLSYEDDVKKYIPELPYEGMTIRHLLNHTSGIPAYEDAFVDWDPKKIAYNEDIIKVLAAKKPAVLFKPGDNWEYSNTGYALLATITERVSGKSFGEFLSERIFKPLEMTRTRIYNTRRSGEVIPNYAYGFVYSDSLKAYVLPDSLKEYSYVYSLDGIQGDGVVNSTTGDLFKWNEALYTDKLVSKTTLDEAFTPGKLNNDSTHRYGFGWAIVQDSIHGKLARHSGGWPGYRTYIVRFVDSGDCIIVLTNNENPHARTLGITEISKRLARFR